MTSMKLIYIASPYTGTAEEMDHRYYLTIWYVAKLCEDGYVPYSPIVHFHPVAKLHDLPRDITYWRRVNTAMLRRCDELHALRIEGWNASRGMKFEMDLAADLNLPLRLISWPE